MSARADQLTLISIVLPVYNEERVLADLVTRLDAVSRALAPQYRFEFVFVDDGSTDGSIRALEELQAGDSRLRIVRLRRNYGQTAALQAGFDAAAGDIVVSMDADLQHFPEDVPRFLARLQEGFDLVCGWRRDRQEGIGRRWPSRAANWMLRKVTRLSIHDIGTTFRAYRADLLRDFRLLGENHRFVPVFARQAGARISEIEIQNVARPVGTSHYGLGRTFNVLLDIVFLVFYVRYLDRPIRFFGKIGLAILSAAVAITLGLVWAFVGHGIPVVRDHTGWFILALVLYLGALQSIFVGVLAELLVRMYFEPTRRAAYSVRPAAVDDAESRSPSSV